MSTVASATPTASGRSLPGRVLDTFVAPGELFAGFSERPPWLGAMLIAVAVAVAVVLLVPSELMVEQTRAALRAGDAPAAGPSPEEIARLAPLFGSLAVLFAHPLTVFATAGLLTLLFGLLLGGEGNYRQHLAVVTHAMLITGLGALVTLPIQIVRGDLELRLSLALLAPFLDVDSFLYGVLNALEVFTLWSIVVMGLGVHMVNRRPSWAAGTAVLLGVYLLIVSGALLVSR